MMDALMSVLNRLQPFILGPAQRFKGCATLYLTDI
jgi:hypothetical protein